MLTVALQALMMWGIGTCEAFPMTATRHSLRMTCLLLSRASTMTSVWMRQWHSVRTSTLPPTLVPLMTTESQPMLRMAGQTARADPLRCQITLRRCPSRSS